MITNFIAKLCGWQIGDEFALLFDRSKELRFIVKSFYLRPSLQQSWLCVKAIDKENSDLLNADLVNFYEYSAGSITNLVLIKKKP